MNVAKPVMSIALSLLLVVAVDAQRGRGNAAILDKYRGEMKKQYYDPTKYKTYLEQLGIKYPTVR